MDARTAAVAHLDAVTAKGVAAKASTRDIAGWAVADQMSMAEFQAQAHACLAGLLGAQSVYANRFVAAEKGGQETQLETQLGILRAVRDDVLNGRALETAHTQVAAEIFDDLFDQATHLKKAGYHVAAASLCGAALEAAMRDAAPRHNLSARATDDLSTLNQKYGAAGVYTIVRRKEVEVWAGVRNQADHGHVDQFTPEDVTAMLAGVRSFLPTLLG